LEGMWLVSERKFKFGFIGRKETEL
jgi:hypothetical protein